MGDTFNHLSELVIETETLEYNGMVFQVRGLSIPHLSAIIRAHKSALEELYFRAAAGVLPADVEQLVIAAAQKGDTLVAMVIACGMGDPDAIEKAGSLPLGKQVEALDKIIRLTIATEGGLGKLVGIVSGALGAMQKLAPPQT